ncbi:MAG: Fur family transcriptional regulator [Candidatus Humimicrobiaceae bacterium]
MKPSFENLLNQLLKNEIRPSHQRVKILEYLITQKCHPTADQIFNDLVKKVPTLSKATIYNTLNLLIKAKLVRVVTIEDNETRYDIKMSNHGHFKCELCGTIFDFTVNIDNFMTDELSEFKINEKNVYFKGICPSCLKYKK